MSASLMISTDSSKRSRRSSYGTSNASYSNGASATSDPDVLAPFGREVVEQRDLFGDAQGVVPREDDDTRAQVHVPRATRDVAHPLQRVG